MTRRRIRWPRMTWLSWLSWLDLLIDWKCNFFFFYLIAGKSWVHFHSGHGLKVKRESHIRRNLGSLKRDSSSIISVGKCIEYFLSGLGKKLCSSFPKWSFFFIQIPNLYLNADGEFWNLRQDLVGVSRTEKARAFKLHDLTAQLKRPQRIPHKPPNGVTWNHVPWS